MNDDLTTLASAYLDGDVIADERAQVEASDELLAEVDRLRTVRAVVSTTASHGDAPISMRERHLSTALDAWDRLPDTERTGALRDSTPSGADRAAAAGVAAMSSPARRSAKRRWTQSPGWLGAAAAGLVLVLAGGLVLRNTASDDEPDTELTSADAAPTAEARAPTALTRRGPGGRVRRRRVRARGGHRGAGARRRRGRRRRRRPTSMPRLPRPTTARSSN